MVHHGRMSYRQSMADAPLFTPLSDRIAGLPLVLAGPIVRRIEPDAATVWVAIREPALVRLSVQTEAGQVRLSGQRATVAIGTHLHIVAVTATIDGAVHDDVDDAGGAERPPGLYRGQTYLYDLHFEFADDTGVTGTKRARLLSPHVICADPDDARALLLYDPARWPSPSFVVPPADVESLRFVHGSCRWPHKDGVDALPTLDRMIEAALTGSENRPHLLIFTGDTVYADGTGAPEAWRQLVCTTGPTLLGWREFLPGVERYVDDIALAERERIHAEFMGEPEPKEWQLFGLGEYLAMYLLVTSDTLWPDDMPRRGDDGKIQRFRHGLARVRRALAHISTLAIFDDHEVADDWNLTLDWCRRVYAKPLGRRVVQNGLSAYALALEWGNQPAQFMARVGEQPPSGLRILTALANWRPIDAASSEAPADQHLLRVLGIPESADSLPVEDGTQRLQPASDAHRWYYQLVAPGYDILVLDGRSRRSFPGGILDEPEILSEQTVVEQIPAATDRVTIVVIAVPVVGAHETRWVRWKRYVRLTYDGFLKYLRDRTPIASYRMYKYDLGDYWPRTYRAFHALLARLAPRRRVVLVSGDVHLAYAARMDYRGDTRAVFAQLTASAMLNQSAKKLAFHRGGYNLPWPEADEPPVHRGRLRAIPGSGAARYTIDYARSDRDAPEGRDIVGMNNVGDVYFEDTDAGLTVTQRVFWRVHDDHEPKPHSVFTVALTVGPTR